MTGAIVKDRYASSVMGPHVLLIVLSEWDQVERAPAIRTQVSDLIDGHHIKLCSPRFLWVSDGLLVNFETDLDLAKFRLLWSDTSTTNPWSAP